MDWNWNTSKIVEDFGGANDLHALLIKEGHDITVRAVRAWVRRDKIPPNWLAVLFVLKGYDHYGWIDHAPDTREVEDIF